MPSRSPPTLYSATCQPPHWYGDPTSQGYCYGYNLRYYSFDYCYWGLDLVVPLSSGHWHVELLYIYMTNELRDSWLWGVPTDSLTKQVLSGWSQASELPHSILGFQSSITLHAHVEVLFIYFGPGTPELAVRPFPIHVALLASLYTCMLYY